MKKLFAPLLALCLALSLLIPSFAYQDYGLLYDNTGKLDTQKAQMYNDNLLKEFGNKYGIELRIDVVDDLEGYELADYADLFYNKYEYGDQETGHGVLLTIQVHADETGLAFDDYNLMAGEKTKEIMSQKAWQEMDEYLSLFLNQTAWENGMDEDNDAFFNAVASYSAGMEYCVEQGEITAPKNTGTETTDKTDQNDSQEPENVTSAGAVTSAAGSQTEVQESAGPYVRDEAGLLSEEEINALEEQAATISSTWKCGVYILTVKDFTADGSDSIRDFSKGYYKDNNLGWGDGKDGEMLVLSMADRDYWLLAYGDQGNSAFTDDNRSTIEDAFLDNFREDDWAGGFADYLTASEELLAEAPAGGGDYSGNSTTFFNWRMLGICVAASCVIALIVCLIFKAQMKSARLKTDASDYVDRGEISIHAREDRFTHQTESRVRIHDDDDDHGGGGGVDSDGFSGGGGKF